MNLTQYIAQAKKDSRPKLVIPASEDFEPRSDSEKVKSLIAKAVDAIIKTNRLRCWPKCRDYLDRLTEWDGANFTVLENEPFQTWISKHFQTFDSEGRQFIAPNMNNCDLIYRELLVHPGIGIASWSLVDELRKKERPSK